MLVGRLAERARIERLLEGARQGRTGALLISGDPGIGKTTLLQDTIERAGTMTVLRATGVPAESDLEYSGLLQLTRPILRHLSDVPAYQATALREALGFDPPRERDRFVVGAGVLSLLAVAAESDPVLCVVDDAQWLDRASADALCFSARRLLADRVAFLFAVRDGEGDQLCRAGCDEMHLDGLDLTGAAELLESSSGTALGEGVLSRVLEATNGNPLALIELCARFTPHELSAWPIDAEPLPIAARLEKAFSSRVSVLPADSRAALLIVTVATVSDVQTLARALDAAGLSPAALEPAEDQGFITIAEGRVLFRHPLVRSAVHQAASQSDRRRAHRALADSLADVGDEGLRAAHLAAAALGPDEEVAAALTAAASTARQRTGYAASAAALEKAARLTPDPDVRTERLTAAAQMAWEGGESAWVLRLVDAADALATRSPQRARLLHLRGRVERRVGMPAKACELLLEAEALIGDDDPTEAARMLVDATVTAFAAGDLSTATQVARRLRHLVPRDASDLDAHADEMLGWVLSLSGRTEDAKPSFERAVELILNLESPTWYALCVGCVALRFLERTRESEETSVRAARAAREDGPSALLSTLELITSWDVQSGHWAMAAAHGGEGLALARALGHADQLSILLVKLARIDAARGAADSCRARVAEIRQTCDDHGLTVFGAHAIGVLGELELALGRVDEAVTVLSAAVAEVEHIGVHERDNSPQPDLIEALIRLGRRDEAAAVLDRYAEWARGGTPLWGGALVARCRGLLADDESFDAHFQQALDLHSKVEDRFQQARTLLYFGERLRRAGRKLDARDRLRLSCALFDELQATPWAERAQRELRATGERLRRAHVAVAQALTPQELQVALPVAEGKTNKETAAELFLSPKTVEFHLASVYRKLGVSSRRELIKRVSVEGLESLVSA
jgi:DNA-binding CsgD family transcriptional regulator